MEPTSKCNLTHDLLLVNFENDCVDELARVPVVHRAALNVEEQSQLIGRVEKALVCPTRLRIW